MENFCPVCGYEMAEPPREHNICPSCGTEFGLHDQNASIEELRQAWLRTGPKWWGATDQQPDGWNPVQQLAKLLFNQVRIPVYWNDYSLGITTVQAAAVELDQTKFGYRLSELQYT
jgi:hypothetical protein